MVSSTDFANSLTVDSASSSHYALKVMTVVALVADAGRPALPGLDVLRLPGPRDRRRGRVPGRGARAEDRRLADGLRRWARSTRASCAVRGRRGSCSESTRRSGSPRSRSCSLQATLLASVVARAFDGAGLGRRAGRARPARARLRRRAALLAWGFDVAGRRAATQVLSELRLDLVERRLRSQPGALDGAEGGEVAAAAVQGVEGARGVLRAATCRRSSSRVSCPSPCWRGSPPSISSPRSSCSSRSRSCRCSCG